jgi:hypothetical protein
MNEKMNFILLEAMDSLKDSIKIEKIGYKYNELYDK